MSNALRNRTRRGGRISTKERAAELEKALAASDNALGETQDGIDQALQHILDGIDILDALLPTDQDPAAEERERELREKLDLLTATAVAEAATGISPEGGSLAERLDEVMDAIDALPAMKWPEGPIGEELPEWMEKAIVLGICDCDESATTEELFAAIAATLSQKGDENPGPQPVENTAAAEA